MLGWLLDELDVELLQAARVIPATTISPTTDQPRSTPEARRSPWDERPRSTTTSTVPPARPGPGRPSATARRHTPSFPCCTMASS